MVRILHVDDMRDQRELVKAVLEPVGYQVIAVESGDMAIGELAGSDFAVVVLDLQMPNGRGELVIQWILENRPHLESRILVTSGDAMSAGLEAMIENLGVSWLAKPYKVEDLRREVDRISKDAQGLGRS